MSFWLGFASGAAQPGPAESTASSNGEDLSSKSFLDGTEPLHGTFFAVETSGPSPLVVLLPEYPDARSALFPTARRLAQKGVAALVVDVRGRGESGGRSDAGGCEPADVLDLIDAAEAQYFDQLDMSRVGVLGYGASGGALALAVAVRAPVGFRSVAVFSGVPDLVAWSEVAGSDGEWVRDALEDAAPGSRFSVRNARGGLSNIRQTRVHLFWDADDPKGWAALNRGFVQAAEKLRMPNVEEHESRSGGLLRWLPGYPETSRTLATAEDMVLGELRENVTPKLPVKGRLRVVGFLKTRPFTVVPGSGEDTMLDCHYSLEESSVHLEFSRASGPDGATAWIEVDASEMDFPIEVVRDGEAPIVFDRPAARIRVENVSLAGSVLFRSKPS